MGSMLHLEYEMLIECQTVKELTWGNTFTGQQAPALARILVGHLLLPTSFEWSKKVASCAISSLFWCRL